MSTWAMAPNAAVAPGSTTGNAPTKSTLGALAIPNAGGSLFLATAQIYGHTAGWLFFYDRLVQTDGLSGTSTSAQTINSTALTRFTDGANVEIWLEVYSALGASSVTATISYTDNVNGSGRTASITIPANMIASRAIRFPLQAGDANPISVQSLTLSATTGTVGNFGVTLLKTLGSVAIADPLKLQLVDPTELGLSPVDSSACVAMMFLTTTTATPQLNGEIQIVDL